MHAAQVTHVVSSSVKAEAEGTHAAAGMTDPPLQEQPGRKGGSCPASARQVESVPGTVSAAQRGDVPGDNRERACRKGTLGTKRYKQLQLPFRKTGRAVAAGCAAPEDVKPPKAKQCATTDQGLAPADLLDAAPSAVKTESSQLGATAAVADAAHGSGAKLRGPTSFSGAGRVPVVQAAACRVPVARKLGRRKQQQPVHLPEDTVVIDLTADSE